MPRNKRQTRRKPKANPRGTVDVRAGGYGFVKTPEGEFFIPAAKMGGAMAGDLVELAVLPAPRRGAGRGAHGGRGSGRPAGRNGSGAGDGHGGRRGAGDGRGAGAGSLVANGGDAPAARVVRVVQRACETLVGRYEVAEPFGVVVPLDPGMRHDIFTLRRDNPDVPDGALVRVRITTFPARNTAATGIVEEVLGTAEDGDFGVEAIIARHKLETSFGRAAREEAAALLAGAGDAHAPAIPAGYRDLTDRFVFTVDPDDARDFDDALSVERDGALWHVGVHIADVSAYVPWGSALDLEARRRATSVYLVDRVLPMLPEELSCELCSLKPGVPRRAFTVDLYLNDAAQLVRSEFHPSIIRSSARLTYGRALALLESPAHEVPASDAAVQKALIALSRLAEKRARARAARGGLEFDTREAKVRLDAHGHPEALEIREKTQATRLVEEMMILANEAVARSLSRCGQPCLYRVHERPMPDALPALIPVMREFPWFEEVDETAFALGDPQVLAAVLAAVRRRPEAELVSTLILRSMQRAVYSPHCDGHYGLASEAYCHFTSPIRRYPDLVVHRMLKERLVREGALPADALAPASASPAAGSAAAPALDLASVSAASSAALEGSAVPPAHSAPAPASSSRTRVDDSAPARLRLCAFEQQRDMLPQLARHASEMERVAEAAARESQEYKMIEYLQGFVGTRFAAVISGVASYGLYVRLENTAEGIVPVRALGGEYFSFDPARYTLQGEDTGRTFRLGSRIAVVLKEAEPRTRTLRFALA